MTKIAIEIDCDGEYCGGCNRANINIDEDVFCREFKEKIGRWNDFTNGACKRCQQCLEAEVNEDRIKELEAAVRLAKISHKPEA